MSNVASDRPNTVTIAVALLFAMLMFGVISAIGLWTHGEALKAPKAGSPYMVGIQAGLLIAGLILNLILQYKVFMGRNWARITALAFFLIGALLSAPVLLGQFPISTTRKVTGLVAMLVQLVAYAMLFTGSGHAWFRRQGDDAQGLQGTVGAASSAQTGAGTRHGPHASRFMRVVFPKLIGFGAMGVGVACIAWIVFMVWDTCFLVPRMMPSYTCTSGFAVSMLLREYGLLTGYAVLSFCTGPCLLARRRWARRMAMAYLLLSMVYLAGSFGWSTWVLLHDRAILGDQLVDQLKGFLWVQGIVVAVLSLLLAFLAVVMARVPWPQNQHAVRAGL